MSLWLKSQVEKFGLFRVVLLIWMMFLVTMVVFWFLAKPEELAGMTVTIGMGVIGIVATVLAFIGKRPPPT